MESRSRRYEISRPKPVTAPPPPVPPPPPLPPLPPPPPVYPKSDPNPWPSSIPRPLSDICELSEPSLMDNIIRHPSARVRHARSLSRLNSTRPNEQSRPVETFQPTLQPQKPVYHLHAQEGGSSSYSSTPEQSSVYTIPQSSVPRRTSSQKYAPPLQPRPHVGNASIRWQHLPAFAPYVHHGHSIPNRGAGHSPVKEAGLRLDPITSDAARRIPSQTHVRGPHPIDILEYPSYKHPRLKLELQVSAPVFVGGGSLEGYIKVTVDDNERVRHRRSISIGAVSVDLLGFEEVDGNRRSTFLSLGTEVVDASHPPPASMVQAADPLFIDDKFWSLVPSCSALPFMISLPLDTGPPPFLSKQANIRFLLSVTAFLLDTGKHYRVRSSQDVYVLPTYDPEKALTSLSSPLTASDELIIPRSNGCESIRVTAGLHRQVWVSGSSIFVDVHISNKTRKPVKRLELALERDILYYQHAAAATSERSAGQARIFERNEQALLATSSCKAGTAGWSGVEPHTTDIRTCELELPRGHGTVRCGKYFEVRYFLNVTVSLSNAKVVSTQLPIILIHMNSLDVVPNSVAQVAAAIEEKLSHRQPSHSRSGRGDEGAHSRQRSVSSPGRMNDMRRQPSFAQGRAFAAPRQQSLDRQREHRADMEKLRNIIDASPRRHAPHSLKGYTIRKVASNISLGAFRPGAASTETLGALGAMSYDTPPPPRTARHGESEAEGLHDRIRRMGSFESIRSRVSPATPRSRSRRRNKNAQQHHHHHHHHAQRRRVPSPGSLYQLAPHALGLTTTTRKVSIDGPACERAATAFGFREKLDRSRFEFKAVRRKASGSLKERGMNWWEQRRRKDREKEEAGWI